MALKFIGKTGTDGQFIIGIPARDLTDAEIATSEAIKAFGGASALVATGLYQVVEQEVVAAEKPSKTEKGKEK